MQKFPSTIIPILQFHVHMAPRDSVQSGAAANFGDNAHRQIWGPNVNNNIYILAHDYSSTGFE